MVGRLLTFPSTPLDGFICYSKHALLCNKKIKKMRGIKLPGEVKAEVSGPPFRVKGC